MQSEYDNAISDKFSSDLTSERNEIKCLQSTRLLHTYWPVLLVICFLFFISEQASEHLKVSWSPLEGIKRRSVSLHSIQAGNKLNIRVHSAIKYNRYTP
jgi:hypothetical protein